MIGNPTRPGDLAEIIAGPNKGRRCYVVDVLYGAGEFDRLCKPLQPMLCLDSPPRMGLAPYLDRLLRPIRDLEPEQAIEHREDAGVEA